MFSDGQGMSELPKRHALSRAEFFLTLAEQCTPEQSEDFEAYLEASIVFARTAIHRLQAKYHRHPAWKKWFKSLQKNPAVEFFRGERNFIVKKGPPKMGQISTLNPIKRAAQLYYYEQPSFDATKTVRVHLNSLIETVTEAETLFSK